MVIEIRIAALADLHGHFPDVPECDVLVIAGDIALHDPNLNHYDQGRSLVRQYTELQSWTRFLWEERDITVIGVGGNHDFPFSEMPGFTSKFPWIYLEDSAWRHSWSGLNFWGSPWQPWLGGWAFNAPEEDLDDPNEPWLDEKFSRIPANTDVLITHAPPAGFHDTVKGAHRGSIALNRHIERVQPRLCVYGHIHKPGVEQIGGTVLCNAAHVGFDRQPNGHPIPVFEL